MKSCNKPFKSRGKKNEPEDGEHLTQCNPLLETSAFASQSDRVQEKISLVDFTAIPEHETIEDPDRIGEMSVFAAKTADKWNENVTPNFMLNQTVTKHEGQWTYSPLKYWPSPGSGYTLSFFAVSPAPSSTNGISLITSGYTPGFPAFTVTPPENPSNQADFRMAKPAKDQTATTNEGKTSLLFDHAMVQISFSAKYESVNNIASEVYVNKIELSGLLDSNTVRFTDSGHAWETPPTGNPTGIYSLSVGKGDLSTRKIPRYKADDTTPNVISTTQGMLYLLPQEIQVNKVKLKITVRINDVSGETETYLDANEWKAGEHYTYNLLVDAEDKVTQWNFGYTNTIEEFVAPKDGTYQIEVCGAQGGGLLMDEGDYGVSPILGSYAKGSLRLTSGQKLYVCVGSMGDDALLYTANTFGGYNPGGGCGGCGCDYVSGNYFGGGGGGAASDVRTEYTSIAGMDLEENPGSDTRIVVAG
ncbi:MAG: fimbrillin family protein, partial [Tannerellaceae bacterium]|nr:fimbrillin family protein [Tannerellaceae bacterium]